MTAGRSRLSGVEGVPDACACSCSCTVCYHNNIDVVLLNTVYFLSDIFFDNNLIYKLYRLSHLYVFENIVVHI